MGNTYGGKMQYRILTILIVTVGLLASFQNCSEGGGQSPFENLSSGSETQVNCTENPFDPSCQPDDGQGDGNELSISAPTTSQNTTVVAPSISITGICNGSGLFRTQINWIFYVSRRNGTNYNPNNTPGLSSSNGRAPVRCNNGNYSFDLENKNSDGWFKFEGNDQLTLNLDIVGYDTRGVPYNNPPNDMTSFNINVLPPNVTSEPPVLDTRAIGTVTNFFDDNMGLNPVRLFVPVGNTAVFENISGYCKAISGRVDEVSIFIQDKEEPTAQPIQIATLNCLEIAGPNPPSPGLNGIFDAEQFQLPAISTTAFPMPFLNSPLISTRHLQIFARFVDSQNLVWDSNHTEIHVRFNRGKGGGWTSSLAQNAISRFKKLFDLNSEAEVNYSEALQFVDKIGVDQVSNNGFGCRDENAGNTKYGLRCKALELFKASERKPIEGTHAITTNHRDPQAFVYRLNQVGLASPNAYNQCDSSLNLTSYNRYGIKNDNGTTQSSIQSLTEHLSENVYRRIENMSLCLAYHENVSVLGRNSQTRKDKFKQMLENGVRFVNINSCRGSFNSNQLNYNYNASQCGCFSGENINVTGGGQPRQNYETGACVRLLRHYDFMQFQYYYAVASKGGNIESNPNSSLVGDFYEGILQKTLNQSFTLICSNDVVHGPGQADEYLNSVVSEVIGRDVTQKSDYWPLENTGLLPSAIFNVYKESATCGSRDVRGSYSAPLNVTTTTRPPTFPPCEPREGTNVGVGCP